MRTLMRMMAIALLACIPAGVSGWLQRDAVRGALESGRKIEGKDEWAVTMERIASWPGRVMWIDARHGEIAPADRVEGALALREDAWERLLPAVLDAWDPEVKLVVFCDGGGCQASREVARRLREETGIGEVYYLQGGVQSLRQSQGQAKAWRAAVTGE